MRENFFLSLAMSVSFRSALLKFGPLDEGSGSPGLLLYPNGSLHHRVNSAGVDASLAIEFFALPCSTQVPASHCDSSEELFMVKYVPHMEELLQFLDVYDIQPLSDRVISLSTLK